MCKQNLFGFQHPVKRGEYLGTLVIEEAVKDQVRVKHGPFRLDVFKVCQLGRFVVVAVRVLKQSMTNYIICEWGCSMYSSLSTSHRIQVTVKMCASFVNLLLLLFCTRRARNDSIRNDPKTKITLLNKVSTVSCRTITNISTDIKIWH